MCVSTFLNNIPYAASAHARVRRQFFSTENNYYNTFLTPLARMHAFGAMCVSTFLNNILYAVSAYARVRRKMCLRIF